MIERLRIKSIMLVYQAIWLEEDRPYRAHANTQSPNSLIDNTNTYGISWQSKLCKRIKRLRMREKERGREEKNSNEPTLKWPSKLA